MVSHLPVVRRPLGKALRVDTYQGAANPPLPVAVLDVSCPLGLVMAASKGVHKAFKQWGRNECSPDALALAVLVELGIITRAEYLRNCREAAASERSDHL